jgi:hypothetical protein
VPSTRFPRKPMKLLDNFKEKIYTLWQKLAGNILINLHQI